ncbi:MAG: DUF3048 domain-containing protein [Acidimicrobiales bacterium]
MLESPKSRIVAGAVAAVLLLGGGALALFGGGDEEAAPTTTAPTTTTTEAATTTTAPQPVAPLTGLSGDFGDRLGRPALFVKIDNAPQARPQAGLNQADILFEERVEGNTTRLAAVFHSQDADPVGPVRSTRSTDVNLQRLFGRPVFASSGANGGVLSLLAEAAVFDVGHNVSGGGFRREPSRPAPHNLMTSTFLLYEKAGADLPAPPAQLFQYRAEGDGLAAGARPVAGVALSYGGPEISEFTWNGEQGRWLRTHRGVPHTDPSGAQVAPANVVVLEIGYDFSGANRQSAPHGVTVGEGRALVFTEGHVAEGRWRRTAPDAPLELISAVNTPMSLTPGQTFIALPPPGGARLL